MIRAGRVAAGALVVLLASCGGGGDGDGDGDPGNAFFGIVEENQRPAAFAPPGEPTQVVRLSAADVLSVLGSAVAEADALGAPATIAVTDRVGNVLAVFEMTGAPQALSAIARPEADGSGLDGLVVPDGARIGAIAKAVTGAYLSSKGNAFSTRTASQIVQENFNPGEFNQPGGPLFGVQFSQLPCSDLNTRFDPADPTNLLGPKRSPLGLSADPGGLPLYKGGEVVGGIGVIADGVYGIDADIRDDEAVTERLDEIIALAGARDFLPGVGITAPRITVEGNTLRYLDGELGDSLAVLASAPGGVPNIGAFGSFRSVPGYYDAAGGALAGTQYGEPASGYVPAQNLPGGNPYRSQSAFVLVDGTGAARFPPRAGMDNLAAGSLTRTEVRRIIDEGIGLALAGRAQIRRPIGSRLQVTVTVVDTLGNVLGLARTPDAPIFGTDVSVQKARAALFFSADDAADQLNTVAGVDSSVALAGVLPGGLIPDPTDPASPGQKVVIPPLSDYVDATRAFFPGQPDVLDGGFAFSNRGIGNIARPFYPDGINGNPPGPLSRDFDGPDTTTNWSPFSTGLQFDLSGVNILTHVLFTLGVLPSDTAPFCTGLPRPPGMNPVLANGLQIFAGSIPIYRNGVLVGAVGVSGDGIDQDDMVASLGFDRAAEALGNGLAAGDPSTRSDRLIARGVRLRYVSCPFAPFLGTDAQNVCEGI